MRTLVWAELRGAWSSWLAVLIAFIATSFAIVLALLLLDSMTATIATGQVPAVQAPALQFIPAWNLALAAIGTLSVIGAVTGLVVQSRRGALARLSLAGATPGRYPGSCWRSCSSSRSVVRCSASSSPSPCNPPPCR